jgi:hypothetical protein
MRTIPLTTIEEKTMKLDDKMHVYRVSVSFKGSHGMRSSKIIHVLATDIKDAMNVDVSELNEAKIWDIVHTGAVSEITNASLEALGLERLP